jgi:hypothetical protein
MENLTPGRRRRCSRSTFRSCSLACASSGSLCYSSPASSVCCCSPSCSAETLGNLHIGHRRQQSPICYIRSDFRICGNGARGCRRLRFTSAADGGGSSATVSRRPRDHAKPCVRESADRIAKLAINVDSSRRSPVLAVVFSAFGETHRRVACGRGLTSTAVVRGSTYAGIEQRCDHGKPYIQAKSWIASRTANQRRQQSTPTLSKRFLHMIIASTLTFAESIKRRLRAT